MAHVRFLFLFFSTCFFSTRFFSSSLFSSSLRLFSLRLLFSFSLSHRLSLAFMHTHGNPFGHGGFDGGNSQAFSEPIDLDSDEDAREDMPGNYAPAPVPQLRRSRAPIDFSQLHSFPNYPPLSDYQPSYMSGTTALHSNSGASRIIRKAASSVSSQSRISIDDIASLSADDLMHNPLHRELRVKFQRVSKALTSYLEGDLGDMGEAHTAASGTLPPDVISGSSCEF
jgi:hypothetical protein